MSGEARIPNFEENKSGTATSALRKLGRLLHPLGLRTVLSPFSVAPQQLIAREPLCAVLVDRKPPGTFYGVRLDRTESQEAKALSAWLLHKKRRKRMGVGLKRLLQTLYLDENKRTRRTQKNLIGNFCAVCVGP